MRTNHEIAVAVEERRCKRIWQRMVLKKTVLCSTFAVMVIVFMGMIAQAQNRMILYAVEESPYASLVFVGNHAGGYVVVGILALILGVVITMVCLHTTNQAYKSKEGEKELNGDGK